MVAKAVRTMIICLLAYNLGAHAQAIQRDTTTGTNPERTRQVTQKESVQFPDTDERRRVLAVLLVSLGGMGILVDQLRRRADKRTE